ncbi:hypothetical protein EYF80_008551 [Liparis tanakae]|uniref:Uncharacterized protein n=1 Tax=Liparis tanakae TaxID=230148 RepID=A0A4Z2ITZ3_9TELE|nr:hypothetical protein EYF80_008551 [Liparis tanakae]
MQVGVSPARVSADAVQADHAAAFVGELQGLCSAHRLEERIQIPLQLGHEGIVISTSEGTEKGTHAVQYFTWKTLNRRTHRTRVEAAAGCLRCYKGSLRSSMVVIGLNWWIPPSVGHRQILSASPQMISKTCPHVRRLFLCWMCGWTLPVRIGPNVEAGHIRPVGLSLRTTGRLSVDGQWVCLFGEQPADSQSSPPEGLKEGRKSITIIYH